MNPAEKMTLRADYETTTCAAIRDFGDHPAVWGFYITDEPLVGNLDAVAQACHIVRRHTRKTPFVNLLPEHQIFGTVPDEVVKISVEVGFENFADYLDHFLRVTGLDYLCYDCYASACELWGGWWNYHQNLARYQAASRRNKVPFWVIMLSMGHWMYPTPSQREMARQFNTALAYGAQGIMYFLYRGGGDFGYGAPVDELGQRSPLYAQLKRQHAFFQNGWERVFRELQVIRTTHDPNVPLPGGVLQRFTGEGVLKRVGFKVGAVPLVIGEFVDTAGNAYVLVASDDAVNHGWVELTFAGRNVKLLTDAGEQWACEDSGGPTVTTARPILPGQGLLYRVIR